MKLVRLLLCSVAPLPFAAQAQVNAPPSQESAFPAEDSATADEIVVTARKREENLQDVPIAITAFTDEDIKSARIEELSDVAKLTSGLNFTPLFGRQNQLPIIRGAAQTFGALNVGVFLDGIYLSGKAGVDLELNDLERIEVVKGPQSALYGRNTFAGAINYITKRPAQEFTGRAEATVGDNGLYKGIASISGPLTDTLRFRVGGFYREFDGWYRSAIDGGEVDFEQGYGGIATLEWQPVEALIATARVSYAENDDGQPPSSVIRTNVAPGVPAGAPATQRRNLLFIGEVPSIPRNGVTVNTQTAPGQPSRYGDREEAIRASFTLEYDFGDATMTSITSYARRDAEFTFDGDNTICDVAVPPSTGCPNFGFPFAPAIPLGASRIALSSTDGFSRDWSQELRFASTGERTVDWLIGFFYYDNRSFSVDRGLSPNATAGPAAFTGFNPNYSFPRIGLDTQSYAAFGSLTWHATDQLAITGELRYEYEKQQFDQCPTFFANPVPPAAAAASATAAGCGATASAIPTATSAFTGPLTRFDLKQDFRFATPRVIVNYEASDDLLLYASYARGAKTGGFNTGLNIFANQRTYEPEYSNNYEVGVKSDLFDRRLRLNVAGYYTDWNDQQAACQNPITAGGSSTQRTYICNVAASTIYGVEIDASAQLTDWFSISGNYAYTHARYDRFVDESLAAALTLAGLPPIDFDGKSLPYVPDHKFVISPRITIPLGGFEVEARADAQYQSNTFVRADNLQRFGDKTVVDLRLSADFDPVTVQLFANNVFDNKRPVAGVRFFDAVNFSVASPYVTGANRRQFGATIGYVF